MFAVCDRAIDVPRGIHVREQSHRAERIPPSQRARRIQPYRLIAEAIQLRKVQQSKRSDGHIQFLPQSTQRAQRFNCAAQRDDFYLTIFRQGLKQRTTTITQPTLVTFVYFVVKRFLNQPVSKNIYGSACRPSVRGETTWRGDVPVARQQSSRRKPRRESLHPRSPTR